MDTFGLLFMRLEEKGENNVVEFSPGSWSLEMNCRIDQRRRDCSVPALLCNDSNGENFV